MTRRERALAAVAHRETDMIPYQVDFTGQSRDRVAELLGDQGFEEKLGCHIDRATFGGPFGPETARPGYFRDDFGVTWDKTGADRDIGMMESILVPEPRLSLYDFPAVDAGLARRKFHELVGNGRDTLKIGRLSMALFERAWSLRGMENLLCDMLLEPAFVEAFLDRIVEYDLQIIDIGLEFEGVDGFYFGDDWGQQTPGLIMGPETWRKYLKPRLKRLYERVKSKGRIVIQHCCGDIYEIYPDLIEIGLDVHNTFQPEIYDIARAKRGVRGGPGLVGRHQYSAPPAVRDARGGPARDRSHHADSREGRRIHRLPDPLSAGRRAAGEYSRHGRSLPESGSILCLNCIQCAIYD